MKCVSQGHNKHGFRGNRTRGFRVTAQDAKRSATMPTISILLVKKTTHFNFIQLFLTFQITFVGSVAEWLAFWAGTRQVTGSIPVKAMFVVFLRKTLYDDFFCLAVLTSSLNFSHISKTKKSNKKFNRTAISRRL